MSRQKSFKYTATLINPPKFVRTTALQESQTYTRISSRGPPSQHKLVILSIHTTAELNGSTRAINSFLTRVVPLNSQKTCGPDMYFAKKIKLGKTYGIRCEHAGQTHPQQSRPGKVSVMAQLARKGINSNSHQGTARLTREKDQGKGQGLRKSNVCLHEDARTDYNDEPGTDLELAKVII